MRHLSYKNNYRVILNLFQDLLHEIVKGFPFLEIGIIPYKNLHVISIGAQRREKSLADKYRPTPNPSLPRKEGLSVDCKVLQSPVVMQP